MTVLHSLPPPCCMGLLHALHEPLFRAQFPLQSNANQKLHKKNLKRLFVNLLPSQSSFSDKEEENTLKGGKFQSKRFVETDLHGSVHFITCHTGLILKKKGLREKMELGRPLGDFLWEAREKHPNTPQQLRAAPLKQLTDSFQSLLSCPEGSVRSQQHRGSQDTQTHRNVTPA